MGVSLMFFFFWDTSNLGIFLVGFGFAHKNYATKNKINSFFFGEHWELPSRELTYPPDKAYLKMIFLFHRWDMLISWRVITTLRLTPHLKHLKKGVCHWNAGTFWGMGEFPKLGKGIARKLYMAF